MFSLSYCYFIFQVQINFGLPNLRLHNSFSLNYDFIYFQMRPWNEITFVNIITNNDKMLQPMGVGPISLHFSQRRLAQKQRRAWVSWSIECLCLNFCMVFMSPKMIPKKYVFIVHNWARLYTAMQIPGPRRFRKVFSLSNKLIIEIIWHKIPKPK